MENDHKNSGQRVFQVSIGSEGTIYQVPEKLLENVVNDKERVAKSAHSSEQLPQQPKSS